MGKNNTSIPKGTRDFGPEEMAKRNYIFDTIKNVYSLYGFQQIETPAIETLNTLLGKYGDEGDKLLFKLLNSGDFLKNISDEELQERNILKLQSKLSKKGLRYDLTVPFARYVVMHRHEIQLPFKRYQIQPVWRADRPQKGRYREFYQCDADIVGSTSLLKKMNRHYSKEDYLNIIKKAKEEIPDLAFSTDIMIGFPGETDEDVQDTIDICEEVRFDTAFTFIYSKRQGTPAAKMEDQIPEEIKHNCLLYTSPSPRDGLLSRMPSSA